MHSIHAIGRSIGVSITAILASTVAGDTLHVPADYLLIQEAIDAAGAGDEVILAPGVYTDSFLFKEDHVVVRSAEGPATTILDGSAYMDYATVYFPPFSSGELHGVTVRDHEHSYTGAVTIKRCVATVAELHLRRQPGTTSPVQLCVSTASASVTPSRSRSVAARSVAMNRATGAARCRHPCGRRTTSASPTASSKTTRPGPAATCC